MRSWNTSIRPHQVRTATFTSNNAHAAWAISIKLHPTRAHHEQFVQRRGLVQIALEDYFCSRPEVHRCFFLVLLD